jgi:hypothetical protein
MINLFKSQPLLDEESIQWMMDCYVWALQNFDARVFYNQTILVVPSNEHFAGKEDSPEGRTRLILEQVKHHAGMTSWPVYMVDQQEFTASNVTANPPKMLCNGSVRGEQAVVPQLSELNERLLVIYQPELLSNPQALIANYVQMLAHYLGSTAKQAPPGGTDNWPHVTELLGVFLGFGLMFANTAYNVRVSSCGSCQGPSAERVNYLSQYDISYALAIFSVLKDIPNKQVTAYLKKSLHPFYKKAVKDVIKREEALSKLKEFKI